MKINELDECAYEHFFEIDDLKKSYYRYTQLHQVVEKCEHIEKIDKRKINRLIKEFKSICKKLIKRDENFDIENYTLYMQSLVTINGKIQKILSARKYRKNKEILGIEKEYDKVNDYLSYSNSLFDTVLNNHTTLFVITTIAVMAIGGLFVFSATKSILGVIFASIFTVLLSILYFVLSKSIIHSFYIDRINRTINRNTYINSLKIRKAYKKLKFILNSKK